MKKLVVVSAKGCTESAKRLAYLLDCPCLLAEEKDYSNYDFVFNYGSSLPQKYKKIINSPQAVKICVNKISTLKRLSNYCSTIEWTKELTKALKWFEDGEAVVIRKVVQGKQGEGIIYVEDKEELLNTPAKLYTKYFYHTNEVRINVFKDKIISVFDKVIKEVEGKIVFEFVPLKITGSTPQIEQMINAIRENIGIDFYGMDVLYNGAEYKLLEINSGAILYPQSEETLVRMIKRSIYV